MPKFILPKEKKSKVENTNVVTGGSDWRRRATLPVNKEILDAVDTDDMVTITLKAKVEGKLDRDSKDYSERHIEVDIHSIEAYPDKEKSDKNFNKGFKKASNKY